MSSTPSCRGPPLRCHQLRPGAPVNAYRLPAAERYAYVRAASRGEMLSPLHFPNVTLAAAEILG